MHNTHVERGLNHYEAICNICGVIARSPTQKAVMEEKCRQHSRRFGGVANVRRESQVVRKGPRAARQRRIAPRGQWIAPRPVVQREAVENPKTYDEWKAYIQAKGLVKLGQGASRQCYALDNQRVIKINYDGWGRHFGDQCAREFRKWQESSAEERQYLATILDHGQGWAIMERAKFVLKGRIDEQTSFEICNDLTETTHVHDLHAANVGYFGGGRFKIIDYGI